MNDTQSPAARESAATTRRHSAPRDPGYRSGYEDGFATGVEVGWGWAEADMADAWRGVATRIRRLANSPTHEELTRRRNHCPQSAQIGRASCRERV